MSLPAGSPVRTVALALDATVRRACDASLVVSCCAVLVMALYGTVDVLSTFVFGRPVPLARELSEVLLAVAIFSAMATALREDRNVTVDLFIGGAPLALRRIARGAALLVGGAVFALLAWRSFVSASDSYHEYEVAMALIRFPIWPAKALVAAAIMVTLAEYVRQFVRLLLGDPLPQAHSPEV